MAKHRGNLLRIMGVIVFAISAGGEPNTITWAALFLAGWLSILTASIVDTIQEQQP